MIRTSAVAGLLAALAMPAAGATIDFGPAQGFAGVSSYSEDGFDMAFTGSSFIGTGSVGNQNFNGFDLSGSLAELDGDATMTITLGGGGTFDFSSILWAQNSPDPVVFTGTRADASTVVRNLTGPLADTPGASVVAFTGFDDLVSLEIDGNGGFFALMDDIVVTPSDSAVVPLPTTLPLLLAGLGGIALARRRRG